MVSIANLFNWKTPGLLPAESPLRHWLLLANIILVNLVVVIASLGASLPLNEIQGYLAVDDTLIAWVESGFLIALGVSVPLSIYYSRKYGFKRMLFIGIIIFVLGSTVSGFCSNYSTLLSSRMFSGIGGGMIFPISLTVIKRVFKGNSLKIAVTIYIAVTFGIGLALGTVIGGILAQMYAWRTIFLLGVYVGIPSLLFTWILMRESPEYPVTKFDLISYLFFTLFLVSTLLYLTQVKAPWNTLGFRSNFSIGCSIVSIVFLTAFIIRYKKAKSPLFALSMFRRKEFTISCFAMACVGIMIFGSSVAFINLLISNYEYERTTTGYLLAGFGICFGIGGLIPILLGKWVKIHFFAVAGLLFIMISCFYNHSLTLQSTPKDILSILILRAIGTSLALGPLTSVALQSISDDLAGQAAAIVTIFRQVGGAYGSSLITIFSTVRFPYHLTRFAEMVNPNSAAFQDYIIKYTNKVIDSGGKPDFLAEQYAKGYLIENVVNQAQIISFNDAFFIFGWIFAILSILMIYLAFSPKAVVYPEKA